MSCKKSGFLVVLAFLCLIGAGAPFAQEAETPEEPPMEAPPETPAPPPAVPAPPAPAPEPAPAPTPAPVKKGAGGRVSLDFRDVELTDLIQTISELTGRNFIYDETVKGRATIISPDPMTLDQAYNLFLTVLAVKGYTVVPSGRVNKVVPARDAKESNLPTYTGPGRAPAEQYITRLVRLDNVDAAMVATAIAPLMPKTSSVVAYPPSNTLILTDNAANVERLMKIIGELDAPSGVDLMEVIALQYADANEAAQLINQILSQGPTGTTATRRRTTRNVQTAGEGQQASRVIPYPRTNALIALATPEDMELIRGLIARIDEKPAQTHAGIYVYYLENADAETLATTLNQIVTGVKAQPRAARAGAQATPAAQAAAQGQQPLGQVAITADKPTNSLIINATTEDYQTIRGIITQLDVKRRQVFVEALIIELSMDATKRLGASLQGAFAVDDDGVVVGTSNLNQTQAGLGSFLPTEDGGFPSVLSQSLNGILLGGLFNPITIEQDDGTSITVPALSALIDVAKTSSDVNILSAPRLLTSDNEEAEIIVGENVPIITQRLTDTGGTGLAQSVSVERRDVALTLRFTPQITEGNLVRLNVLQEITDIAATSVGDINQVGPTLTKRLLRNTVLAENGRTVVLGGLISNNQQQTISKVPLLGDIPGLGWLFKHKRTTDNKTNLLVFITPRVIRTPGDMAAVTNYSRKTMEDFRQGIMPAVPTQIPGELIQEPINVRPPVPLPESQ